MKIQVLSDLHLEFEEFEYQETDSDVVVLAGDIMERARGLDWALSEIRNKPVIFIFGNHDYYHGSYSKSLSKAKSKTKGTNVHVLENSSIRIDEVNFLACTLWTDFKLFGNARLAAHRCQEVMNDYRYIRKSTNYSRLTPADTAAIHTKSRSFLSQTLKRLKGQTNVVITHHAPTINSVLPEYKNDLTTSAYASNLESLIVDHDIDLWIHGHNHNSSDYVISNTRIVANPKGYRGENRCDFDSQKVFEVLSRRHCGN